MENTRRSTIFAIDGYEVSASFADDRNTTALHHAKQILLSSFANNTPNSSNKGILAILPEQRDNNDEGSPYVPCYANR